MSDLTYTIFGAEESPYSVKVRSYFRYKQLPHEWKGRHEDPDTYSKHARLPLIPLVVDSDGSALQDSTPIIETLEATYSSPSIYPADPVARFVSDLLEEFGDEWGNKWMFHYRWAREVDQVGCATRLVKFGNPSVAGEQLETMVKNVVERMVNRVWFVGSNATTAPQIEQSFQDMLLILDNHLENRSYLFGERPSFADFGMWGQIYNANRDTTPSQFVQNSPNVKKWIERMLNPQDLGPFESWNAVKDSLMPLLKDQVGGLFLPWSVANSQAIATGQEEFEVDLPSGKWTQKPQKYHARSLNALRDKFSNVADNLGLRAVLQDTGCLAPLISA